MLKQEQDDLHKEQRKLEQAVSICYLDLIFFIIIKSVEKEDILANQCRQYLNKWSKLLNNLSNEE